MGFVDDEGVKNQVNGETCMPNGYKHEHRPATRHIQPHLTATYPSRSLSFLKSLQQHLSSQSFEAREDVPAQARLTLDIVVVGAGLGGLSVAIALARRGHTVRVLEQASQLGEVGAGIQVPPNSGRLLRRWGVQEHLQKLAVLPEDIKFRRWQNGNVIAYTALGQGFRDDFEEPYCVVHRAHFHNVLYERALELGVRVDLASKVVKYDDRKGIAVLESGSTIQADLLVAADGIKSLARQAVHPDLHLDPKFNGFAAYRATVDAKRMKDDPEIAWIIERPSLNIWIGEHRHVMTYPIAAGKSFNMVLSHIDHSDPTTWGGKFVKEDIQREFTGWDPQLTKLISLVDECMKWPLKVGKKLPSWTSPSSKLVLLGDAAHAMLPYMSQGAAMAVEDGAALAIVLNHIASIDELPFALRTFEEERLKRSGNMQDASTVNGVIWHFADGPEQLARDASTAAEVAGLPFSSSGNQWSDPITQWWAYGYDAEQEMEKAWDRAVSNLISKGR